MGRKITAIETQKRNKDRVSIYLDGEYSFGLARIVAAWLQVGQELSEEKIAELTTADGHELAYTRALRLLNQQDRSESQIRLHLQRQGIADEIVNEVIERLVRAGLVNDERYAQNWVDNRNEFRPRSRRALAYELKLKGISREAAEQALGQLDEDQLAYQAARKQARKLNRLPQPEFRQKMLSFLARRGFSYETSAPITDQVWAEEHVDDEFKDFETTDEVNR
ncbi:MAG: hypothetical protein A2W33_04115 [Chloroflexi bacterium RBG_16_52_11]|nr:MAG: hypothetical protein A2W33_04115 [Chloroflexi bacterium RBG_16_52_11]